MDRTEELREALKKDFNKLYVKEYSTTWEIERLVRGIEIDIMPLTNILTLFSQEAEAIRKEAIDDTEYAIREYLCRYVREWERKGMGADFGSIWDMIHCMGKEDWQALSREEE
jgi:hypothetical protein